MRQTYKIRIDPIENVDTVDFESCLENFLCDYLDNMIEKKAEIQFMVGDARWVEVNSDTELRRSAPSGNGFVPAL